MSKTRLAYDATARLERRHLAALCTCLCLWTLAVTTPSWAGDTQSQGTWFAEADRHNDDPDRIYLEMREGDRSHHNQTGMLMSIRELTGVTRSQIDAGTDSMVFTLEREAGTTAFEGRFHKGTGSGTWTFALNEAFESGLRQRGYRNIRLREYQVLALHDVTLSWVDELEKLGFADLDVDDLLAMSIHGADLGFIHEMRELGIDSRDIDDWVAMRIHGVTKQFVEEMEEWKIRSLDVDRLIAFRIHGVDAEFVEELLEMGYDDLTADELVELRIHGVDRQTLRKWNRQRDRSQH